MKQTPEKLFRIPWKERGRDYNGCDCYGLVRLAAKEIYNLDFPALDEHYDSIDDHAILEKLIYKNSAHFKRVENHQPGDVILFKILGYNSHVGLCLQGDSFLHMWRGKNACVERFLNPSWSNRIDGFYRYSPQYGLKQIEAAGDNLNRHAFNCVLQSVAFQGKKQTVQILPEELRSKGFEPNLKNILASLGLIDFSGAIMLNGYAIDRSKFDQIFPQPGCLINIVRVPQKGGDGGGGKDLRKTLTSIAIIAAASWLAGPILGGHFGLWTSGSIAKGVATTAIAAMMGKALVPPQVQAKPNRMLEALDPEARSYSITDFQNTPNPNGPYPVIYGKRKIFPPPGAEPYTEIIGGEVWLRQLFMIGYGPLDISTVKIGQTAIGDYSDVSYNIKNGWPDDTALSIYTNDTHTEAVNALVVKATPVTRTTQADTTRISVDVCFQQGLFELSAAGAESQATVAILIEYSIKDADDWSTATTITATEESTSVVWKNHAWDVSEKQYDVRITRVTDDSTESNVYDKFYFYQLKSIAASSPCNVSEMAMIEVKIKATDQLNGIIDRLSCIAEAYVPVLLGTYTDIAAIAGTNGWTSSSTNLDTLLDVGDYIQVSGFTDNDNNYNSRRASSATMAKVATVGAFACTFTSLVTVADEAPGNTIYIWKLTKTRNPAWSYIDLARGKATLNPVEDSKIYTSDISTWATNCTAAGYKFDYKLDCMSTQRQLMNLAAAAGRARWREIDGKLSIAEDVLQSDIKGMFTSRNCRGLKGHKSFIEQPHAFEISFENEDADYVRDIRTVYASGYDEDIATKIEPLDLAGIVDPDQVWKEGKYRYAVIEHRPEVFSLNVDFEKMLIDGIGNLVLVAHDSIEVGLDSARITALTLDGTDITHITLDETCTMTGGTDYGVTIRLSDNSYILSEQVVTDAGDQTTLELTTPISAADPQPAVGDLVEFGEYESETLRCIVTEIHNGPKNSADLTLTNEGPAVYTSDSGEIPEFTTTITIPEATRQKFPPDPVLLNIRSNEEVLIRQGRKGDLITRALLSFAPPTQLGVPAKYYEVRYKRANETAWKKDPAVLAENGEISVIGLEDAVVYDFQVRAISEYGMASNWTTCSGALTAYTVIGKSTDPSDVTGFSVAIQGEKIRSSWTKVDDRDVSNYVVRYGETSDDWDDMLPVNDDSGETGDVSSFLSDALIAGTYKFAIKAKDTSGNVSDTEATANITISAPATPSDNGSQAEYNKVKFQIQDCTQTFPIQHYLFYRGSGSDLILLGTNKTTSFTYIETQEGEIIYTITAIDIAGNVSTAGEITLNITAPPDFKLLTTLTSKFDGTHDNTLQEVLITGYQMKAVLCTTKTGDDFISDFGDIAPTKPIYEYYPRDSGSYQETWDYGADITGGGIIQLEIDSVAVLGTLADMGVTPTISLSADDISYTDYVGVWSVAHTDTFRYVKITLDFLGSAVNKMINITAMRVKLKKEYVYERGEVLTGDAVWTGNIATVTFTKSFIDIESFLITPYDAGGAASFDTTGWRVANPTTATVTPYVDGISAKIRFTWETTGT